MSQNRIVFLFVSFVLLLATAAYGQEECVPEEILATSNADTIFVEHLNVWVNCCLELSVAVDVQEFVVNFYEGDLGPPCDCLCCFNLHYDAHGFAAGHYVVRVWNEDGSFLHGETEVDVEGPGGTPIVGGVDRGECLNAAAVRDPEPSEVSLTWGEVRAIYR